MSLLKPQSTSRPIRALIIGGGIAGLTLANALQKADANIEYLILESRDIIAPQVGASIGLAPSGSRILDQLGCYEDLDPMLEPVTNAGIHDSQGRDMIKDNGGRSDALQLIRARTTYPITFLERRSVLQVLFEHIRDKSCILTNKKVQKIEQDTAGATVFCADGTQYKGDIVVGADGVNSNVRREMWRAAENQPNVFDVEKERKTMTAEYKCLFGISRPISGLNPGSYDVTHAKDVSTMTITGKGSKVYWFLFGRMSRVYKSHEIPSFSSKDAALFASQHKELSILAHGQVKFRDLWETQEVSTLVALEEADFERWTLGRLVCIGDSAHKMTPNAGSGGMMAIETAASLANAIYSLAASHTRSSSSPTMKQVGTALEGFEIKMKSRASKTIKEAAEITRLQALRGVKEQFILHYVIPYANDFIVYQGCDGWIGATKIDYLPVP